MTDVNPTSLAREAATKTPAPSPALLFDTINSYQKTAAIKAAVELDIFTVLAGSPETAEVIARHAKASPRGIRILCDFLTVLGFLTKSGDDYGLTHDSVVFLSRKSLAYAGSALEFLLSDHLRGAFELLTGAVRKGGTAQPHDGSVAPEHPMWISFARIMGPLMALAAGGLAPSTKNKRLLVIYSIPTRGFTTPASVLRGTPPPKPLELFKEWERGRGLS